MSRTIRIRLLAFVLTCVSIFALVPGTALATRAHAAEAATPYYNNTLSARTTVAVSSTGELSVVNSYRGFEDATTKAVITTYVIHFISYGDAEILNQINFSNLIKQAGGVTQ